MSFHLKCSQNYRLLFPLKYQINQFFNFKRVWLHIEKGIAYFLQKFQPSLSCAAQTVLQGHTRGHTICPLTEDHDWLLSLQLKEREYFIPQIQHRRFCTLDKSKFSSKIHYR